MKTDNEPKPGETRACLKVPKAAELIARRIKQRIVSRELVEGELLPPEVKLMEEFGVSRPTIREAYRILETEHLVSVTRGARGGAVVHRPDTSLITAHTLLALAWDSTTVADVYETRAVVEPALVRRVAEVASHQVIKRLQPLVDEAVAKVDDVSQIAAVLTRFLDELLDLAGDQLLTLMYLTVREVLGRHQSIAMAEALRARGYGGSRVELHAFLAAYQTLVDLMSQGKAAEAEDHWRHHISHVFRTWVKDCNRTIVELFPEYK